MLLSDLVNRLIPSYFFFVIILQKMSNPDGDEDMNSAQSHYIEVAQGDISHEKKNLDSGRAFYGQHIEHLHCTTNLVASCHDYQISSLNFMSLSNSKFKL